MVVYGVLIVGLRVGIGLLVPSFPSIILVPFVSAYLVSWLGWMKATRKAKA